ncbi:hypothetical protein LAZ67_X003159 [Cordylochernes scorpioides]|uniref:RNase H type-1 domain-containing protein n=1 Tax=Cordylochernes scorpioides TaxID=51811 RepID=A0ABY6LUD7_9ARAC|nr:hypothetical protein LAZ67_X003159 [Cordylochernes scorpioides]
MPPPASSTPLLTPPQMFLLPPSFHPPPHLPPPPPLHPAPHPIPLHSCPFLTRSLGSPLDRLPLTPHPTNPPPTTLNPQPSLPPPPIPTATTPSTSSSPRTPLLVPPLTTTSTPKFPSPPSTSITNIFRARNKIIIHTNSKNSMDSIYTKLKIATNGTDICVNLPPTFKPRFTLFNLPNTIPLNDLPSLLTQSVGSDCKLIRTFTFTGRNNSTHAVIETDTATATQLQSRTRLFLGYNSIRFDRTRSTHPCRNCGDICRGHASRVLLNFSPLESEKLSLQATNLVWADSPFNADELPARYGLISQTTAELSAKNYLQLQNSKEIQEMARYANLPTGEKHANSDTLHESASTMPLSGANLGQLNREDFLLDQNHEFGDDYTVVQNKRRRRDTGASGVRVAQFNSAGSAARRQRSAPALIPCVEEIRTTRMHIAEARARQATCTEEQCFFLEYCPDYEPYHYLKAIGGLVGGTKNIVQFSKVNGQYLVGLTSRSLEERLIQEGLEVEGTLLRTFPFRRTSIRITIENLPFFVRDAVVIDALARYGCVTSIAPKQLKVGEFDFTDGRREAFILRHDGMTVERLPSRFEIKIKGEAWPAYLTHGIKCSRCHGQGHRRANCPLLHGQSTTSRRASPPSTTNLPPSTAPGLPGPSPAAPTPPAPTSPAVRLSGAQPDARAVSPPSTAPRSTTPAPPASSVHVAAPAPPPEAPAPEHPASPRSAATEPTPPARPDFTTPCGPLPAQGTLGPATHTPDVDMTTTEETSASSPAAVISTLPLPAPRPAGPTPPVLHEEQITQEQEDVMIIKIFRKLKHMTCLKPLYDTGIDVNDLRDAILFTEDRASLMTKLSPALKGVLAEFLGAAIELARGYHPDLNCNRSLSGYLSLLQFAQSSHIDILLLQELPVRDNALPSPFPTPFSSLLHAPISNNRCNTCIVVLNQSLPIIFLPRLSTTNRTLAILDIPGFHLTLCSVYFPHKTSYSPIVDSFISLFDSPPPPRLLFAGDVNAVSSRWSSQKQNSKGTFINTLLDALDLKVCNTRGAITRSQGSSSSSIDISRVSSSILSSVSGWTSYLTDLSDHYEISFSLSLPPDTIPPLLLLPPSLISLSFAFNLSLPCLFSTLLPGCAAPPKTALPPNRSSLQSQALQAKKTYVRALFKAKRDHFRKLCSSFTHDPWGSIHRYITRGSSRSLPLSSNSFQKSLLHCSTPAPFTFPPFLTTPPPPPAPSPDPPFMVVELSIALRNLRLKKSCGLDFLPGPFSKWLIHYFPNFFLSFFNSCFSAGHFPSLWKAGRLILLPKRSTSTDFHQNCRPIILLPILGKLLESLMAFRLTHHFESNHLLHPLQFSFRRRRSTTDALSLLHNKIKLAVSKHQCCLLISLDIKSAFDHLWHPALFGRLVAASCPPPSSNFVALSSPTALSTSPTEGFLAPPPLRGVAPKVLLAAPSSGTFSLTPFFSFPSPLVSTTRPSPTICNSSFQRLSFTPHLYRVCEKASSLLGRVSQCSNAISGLGYVARRQFYCGVVDPAITYAAPIWCEAAKIRVGKASLCSLQRKFCVHAIRGSFSSLPSFAPPDLLPFTPESPPLPLSAFPLPHSSPTSLSHLSPPPLPTSITTLMAPSRAAASGPALPGSLLLPSPLTFLPSASPFPWLPTVLFFAFRSALSDLCNLPPHLSAPISSDCLSLLSALSSPHSPHPLIAQCQTLLYSLLPSRNLTLHWVKGHSGNLGNCQADTLAKGATVAPSLPPQYTLAPKTAHHKFLFRHFWSLWDEEFISAKPSFFLKLGLSPSSLSSSHSFLLPSTAIVTGLLTGPTFIAAFPHRKTPPPFDPTCPHCNQAPETIEHIFFDCPNLDSLRATFFNNCLSDLGHIPTSLPQLFSSSKAWALTLDFATHSNRFIPSKIPQSSSDSDTST